MCQHRREHSGFLEMVLEVLASCCSALGTFHHLLDDLFYLQLRRYKLHFRPHNPFSNYFQATSALGACFLQVDDIFLDLFREPREHFRPHPWLSRFPGMGRDSDFFLLYEQLAYQLLCGTEQAHLTVNRSGDLC